MDSAVMRLTEKGLDVLSKAEGGSLVVHDRVLVDTFESLDEEKDKRLATIIKIYYRNFETGKRELADVLFDGSSEISKGHFTMFMERV